MQSLLGIWETHTYTQGHTQPLRNEGLGGRAPNVRTVGENSTFAC